MADRDHYEPFEPEYIRDLRDEVLRPLVETYFRPRVLGAQRLPQEGAAVLASNHSGTAFPWDAMLLDFMIWEREGAPDRGKIRPVFEKELTIAWWMRPFGLDNFWRRGGGVDMTFDNFDRLLAGGHRVLYYPEGVPGIGKGFQRRYQLQRYSSSFVIMAARNEAPVVPIYTINAEWVVPFNFTFAPLDRLLFKVAHVPFLPLPAGPLGILFPWLWYLSLPSRMIFVVGDPIDVAAKVRERGVSDLESPDRDVMRGIAEEVRLEMQEELHRLEKKYGRWPYQTRLLRRRFAEAFQKGNAMGALPFTWPLRFVRHDRDRQRPKAPNRLWGWLRDWDLIGFFLPLGWFALALTRRFRKPPYGFRGLSREEQRAREGSYVWRLAEQPLPPRTSEPPDS